MQHQPQSNNTEVECYTLNLKFSGPLPERLKDAQDALKTITGTYSEILRKISDFTELLNAKSSGTPFVYKEQLVMNNIVQITREDTSAIYNRVRLFCIVEIKKIN